MVALAVEFSLVVAWFIWMHRRERGRERARRTRASQMRLPFDKDREVGS